MYPVRLWTCELLFSVFAINLTPCPASCHMTSSRQSHLVRLSTYGARLSICAYCQKVGSTYRRVTSWVTSRPVTQEIRFSGALIVRHFETDCGSSVFLFLVALKLQFCLQSEVVHEGRRLVFATEREAQEEKMEREDGVNFMRLLSGKRSVLQMSLQICRVCFNMCYFRLFANKMRTLAA